MEKERASQLKILIENEISFRTEFRDIRKSLEYLVDPITKHNSECCKFWSENFAEAKEILVMMDNDLSLKIVKPQKEACRVETYLPFGIDYTECTVINMETAPADTNGI